MKKPVKPLGVVLLFATRQITYICYYSSNKYEPGEKPGPLRREAVMAQVISSQEFESKVLQAEGPVMVDFFATWCGPCRMLGPVLDEVSQETAGQAAVYKVDVDQSPDLAARYGVSGVPAIMVFQDGQVTKSTVGFQPKQNLLQLLS